MSTKGTILSRIGLIYIIALLASAAIVGKIVYLQFFIADEWKEDIKRYSQRTKEVPANRGNILDSDGNIIASTVPTYNISIDPNSDPMDPVIFEKEVSGLAQGLAQMFGEQSAWYYENRIRSARNNKSRHLLLVKNATYQEKEKVKDLPLFRHGPYKGGMKIEVVSSRKRPYNSLAKRTIGYSREGDGNKYIGLEGMFDSYLKGKDGERVEYRLGGSNWVPASSVNSKDPEDGIDIVSTLNMNYQDVAESALRELLEKNHADHGCAILMEVSTGHIKAMVNLGRIEDGSYHEIYNYAVGEKHEPGSTFKLPSLIAALETGRISLEDTINTFNGVYKFGGEEVKDSRRGGYGVITVQQVFEKSSNIGMGRIAEKVFKNKPEEFIERLYSMGLKDKTEISIEGEQLPYIKHPDDKKYWYDSSLPFIAHGYEIELSPIQILTFYNAVANGGKMVAPMMVKEIRYHSSKKKVFEPKILKNSICSKETIEKARRVLEGVVTNGTAKNLEPKAYTIAGKTGTAVMAQPGGGYINDKGGKDYRASFAGYFPADKPAYSCIVVVTKPQGQYYGNVVAGEVFQEIADKVYATDPRLHPSVDSYSWEPVGSSPYISSGSTKDFKTVLNLLDIKSGLNREQAPYVSINSNVENLSVNRLELEKGTVPDVRGMGLIDALPLLENQGLKVNISGYGHVVEQSLVPGQKITAGQTINLKLKVS